MAVVRTRSFSPPSGPVAGTRFRRSPVALALLCATLYAAGGLSAVPAFAQGAAPAGETRRSFDIPAGTLDQALSRFGRQSGAQIAVNGELTAGLRSPGVSGLFGLNDALRALLVGTGLEALRDAGGEYTLRRQAAPAPSASQGDVALPLVTVTATADTGELPLPYAGGQVARGSRIGMLGNKDVMDTPFSITSYTAELMENQQAITVADVLANDPSVRTLSYGLTNAAGAGDSFMIRGFSIQNSVLFDGLYGIAPSRTLPVETAERVEVLKGPNALLNGMAPYDAAGGAINIVPKRASDEPLTRLTSTYLSRGVLGGHIDVSRRFGEDKQWGVRFNGVYRDGSTATRGQSVELGAATIGLDYRGDRLRASLDAGHQRLNNEAPQGAGGFGIADGIDIPRPPSARGRLAQDWEFAKTRSDYFLAKAEYDLAPDWTLYGAAGGSNNRFRYLSTDVIVADTQGNAQATVYYWPDFQNYRTVQGGLRGTLRTAGVKHQINLSAAYLKQEHGFTTDYYGFASFDTNMYASPSVAAPSIAGFSSKPPRTDSLRLPSVAVSDTVSFLDDRVSVTLGARHQQVKYINYDTSTGVGTTTHDKSAVTPVLAVLFKPQANLSLYGNYIEGLSKGDTAPIGTTNANEVFPPIKTKQYEVGAKYDFGRFAVTAGLFQIQKPSGLVVGNPDGSFTYQVAGEQRNRGAELGLFGELARGVRLLGGIAYTDGRLTQTDGGVNNGNLAPNVSRWQLNLGGEYDVPAAPGLTLTARMISTSSQYLNAANSRSVPGWTRWDVGARYVTKAWDRPLVLRAGVENLLGRDYWASGSGTWLYVGRPRTLMVSATVDF